MREYLFHGKREDNGEWVEGFYHYTDWVHSITREFIERRHYIWPTRTQDAFCVIPESIGQYTGMSEFVLTDESRNAKLFEGDIVEVWGWRSVYGRNQSQHDKRVKVRGVIYFNSRGQWYINYDNKYNESIAKLKGSETEKRQVHGAYELYYYGYHGSDIEGHRAKRLEWHRKFHENDADIINMEDIVKIGTVFDNADLLEG